jgi:hypothetical protein
MHLLVLTGSLNHKVMLICLPDSMKMRFEEAMGSPISLIGSELMYISLTLLLLCIYIYYVSDIIFVYLTVVQPN